jgi:hypothetical protein
VAYNDEDYYHTASWMSEAMNKLEKEENKTMNKSDIIDYLSFALYQVNIPVFNYFISSISSSHRKVGSSCHGHECVVVGFTTACAISAHHH